MLHEALTREFIQAEYNVYHTLGYGSLEKQSHTGQGMMPALYPDQVREEPAVYIDGSGDENRSGRE